MTAGGGPERSPAHPGAGPEVPPRAELARALAAAIDRSPRRKPPPAPDVLELFTQHLAFLDSQYPDSLPSPEGSKHLDDLIKARMSYVKRTAAVDTADRVAGVFVRVCGGTVGVAVAAAVGRVLGFW